MLILGLLLAVSVSQAATLLWGSGTSQIKNAGGVGNLTGVLVELYFVAGGGDQMIDSTAISNAAGFKGTFASTVNFPVATYAAGTEFYMVVYDSVDNSGNQMIITLGGINEVAGSETFFLTTPVTDTDSQTMMLSDNGFAAAIEFVPEPTSMALLGLGIAALGMRRKFRK